jgi:hypothetical protein
MTPMLTWDLLPDLALILRSRLGIKCAVLLAFIRFFSSSFQQHQPLLPIQALFVQPRLAAAVGDKMPAGKQLGSRLPLTEGPKGPTAKTPIGFTM